MTSFQMLFGRRVFRKTLWASPCVAAVWVLTAMPVRSSDVFPPETVDTVPYIQSLGQEFSDEGLLVLFMNSLEQRFLNLYSLGLEAEPWTVARQIEGFSASGRRVLVWPPERSRLEVVDLMDGSRRIIWEGAVAEQFDPILSAGRVWWMTTGESGQVLVSLRLDAPGDDLASVASAPLPTSQDLLHMWASRDLALLSCESCSRAWLWKPGTDWMELAIPDGRRVVGLAGSSLLAVDRVQPQVLYSGQEAAGKVSWKVLFASGAAAGLQSDDESSDPKALYIDPASVRLSDTSDEIVFLNTGEGRQVVFEVISLDGRLRDRIAFPSDRRASHSPSDWAYGNSVLSLAERKQGRLRLIKHYRRDYPQSEPREDSPKTATKKAPSPRVEARSAQRLREATRPEARAAAMEWLRGQLGPVAVSEDGARRRLIDSYEDGAVAGWTYDAALAVIAFAGSGELSIARELLAGLEHIQQDNGSWVFSFDPIRLRPHHSKTYVGTIAWVVMAANFYEWESGDGRFSDMARKALRYLSRFQSRDMDSLEFGGISMGPASLRDFSTEHNADSYSAFFWRGTLEDDAELLSTAERIRDFILEVLWAERALGPGNRFFQVGIRDPTLYLDPQSWTVLSLVGPTTAPEILEDLRAAVERAGERLEYGQGVLGPLTDIVGFNEAEGLDIGDKVWAEGTEGMVAAYRVLGEEGKAKWFHSQTRRYQSPSGGIPYATENRDGWSIAPSVASTSWFLLNELRRNPFRPGSPD